MHYLDAKRIQKIIAFLRMVIDCLDKENTSLGKFNVISSQRDVFYHLFYENNHVEPTLTFAFEVEQIVDLIHTIEVCSQANICMNDIIQSPRKAMGITILREKLGIIIDSLERYIRGDSFKIFYAWQSDINSRSNRNFIESSLDKAIQKVNTSLNITLAKDKDTKGETGSPDIAEVIFNKINKSLAFVADISFVNKTDSNGGKSSKGIPNANVMIEYGYASAVLGEENIITVFNTATGNVGDIPFDIKQNRIMFYRYDKSMEDGVRKREAEKLIGELTKAIDAICRNRLGI